ncbi:MAG: DUF262 domain-containing protein [Muribaculaceae bacterium]|nr:DUF262 domain-containing protein [Muribaculaceae bacterium]
MPNIVLDTKNVGEIVGEFYLPDYQRGYRWTEDEIRLLLDDIYESGGKPYCLQPIVVKKTEGGFELIDGQQRLTTIYLIFKYMESQLGRLYAPGFSLSYETRETSGCFLKNLDMTKRESNIDFHFIANAYEYIERYFENRSAGNPRQLAALLTTLNQYFMETVSVIWYEVDSAEDGIKLFERLNIGKIPLTSSELVKALFLKDSAKDQMSGRQEEVSLQWDMMEHELHGSSFWGFLSNLSGEQMSTRIDFVLDLMSGKNHNAKDKREKYSTFFYFDSEIKRLLSEDEENPLLKIWARVYHLFLTLREWYEEHDFYHKIGYLISVGTSMDKIYNAWKNGENEIPLAKDKFMEKLDEMISESIDISSKDELLALGYDSNREKLHRVLTLFNVETERLMDEGKRCFPFDKHKDANWSLEHVHAQNAENLTKNKDILAWLESHFTILNSDTNDIYEADEPLLKKMKVLINELRSGRDPGNVRDRFRDIQEATVILFSPRETMDRDNPYLHGLANMALLDSTQNAALSNSVFDVKRQRIIEYDKKGKYIPICTKNLFFKYYSKGNPSLSFWGESDRRNYVEAIDERISPYYTKKKDDSLNA